MYKSMAILMMLGWGCNLALAQSEAGFPKLPDKVSSTLDRLQNLLVKFSILSPGIATANPEELEVAKQTFDKLLDQLSLEVPNPLDNQIQPFTGKRIEAKLIAIALDRSKNLERYNNLHRYYFVVKQEGPIRPRVLHAPQLAPEHTTEPYRLAWEYLLLSPDSSKGVFLSHYRALQALAAIKSTDSFITLKYAFELACDPNDPHRLQARPAHILSILSLFISNEALQAMLDCVEIYKLKVLRNHEVKSPIEDHVFRLLTGQENRGNVEQWRKVLGDFPTETLTQDQKRLIQRSLMWPM